MTDSPFETLDQVALVGNQHEPQPMYERRTPEQRAAILAIGDDPEFDFWCSNPLTAEVNTHYTGPIVLSWYTRDSVFHCRRIGRRGRTLWETTG